MLKPGFVHLLNTVWTGINKAFEDQCLFVFLKSQTGAREIDGDNCFNEAETVWYDWSSSHVTCSSSSSVVV